MCLKSDPSLRIKWEALRKHPFFKKKILTPIDDVIENDGIVLSLHSFTIDKLYADFTEKQEEEQHNNAQLLAETQLFKSVIKGK